MTLTSTTSTTSACTKTLRILLEFLLYVDLFGDLDTPNKDYETHQQAAFSFHLTWLIYFERRMSRIYFYSPEHLWTRHPPWWCSWTRPTGQSANIERNREHFSSVFQQLTLPVTKLSFLNSTVVLLFCNILTRQARVEFSIAASWPRDMFTLLCLKILEHW